MRRRLPQGVRMYTGDDFNYAELIAGDEQGLFRRAARHLRRDRAGGLGRRSARSRAATQTASTTSSRRPCRCRATSSRRRRASTRPASCSSPISTATRTTSPWSAGSRARARSCISPSCSASPTRRGCCATPTRAAARMRARARRARRRLRCAASGPEPLSINTATVREQCGLARGWSRPAPAHGITAHRALARPGRGGRARRSGAASSATTASASPAYCRGGMFPAADGAGRQAALDDNRRAIDEAAALGARLPGAGRRRPARGLARHRARPARWSPTASPRSCRTRAPPACRWRSSRCIRCTPPTAPA